MQQLKTFFGMLVTYVISVVSTTGLPVDKTAWIIFAITLLGTALTYVIKCFTLPSITIFGTIDLRDWLSGFIMAMGSGISAWAAMYVAGTPFSWSIFGTAVLSIACSYLGIKAISNPSEKGKVIAMKKKSA